MPDRQVVSLEEFTRHAKSLILALSDDSLYDPDPEFEYEHHIHELFDNDQQIRSHLFNYVLCGLNEDREMTLSVESNRWGQHSKPLKQMRDYDSLLAIVPVLKFKAPLQLWPLPRMERTLRKDNQLTYRIQKFNRSQNVSINVGGDEWSN